MFSKDVSFENSFTIESERTSYIISTLPSTRGDVCPSAIRWKWVERKFLPARFASRVQHRLVVATYYILPPILRFGLSSGNPY